MYFKISVKGAILSGKTTNMDKQDFLKLAAAKWPELEQLKQEKRFYDYEKRFEEIWIELGREVLESSIGSAGKDHRVKKKILTRFGKVDIKNTHPFSKPVYGFSVSPYLQEQATFISQMEVYGQANQTVEKLLRVNISTSQLYRITDTYGELVAESLKQDIPPLEVNKDEVVYAQLDGGMIFTDDGWQEVKVGRIFRQSDIKNQSKGTVRQHIVESQYAAHLRHCSDFVNVFGKGLQHYEKLGDRLVFVTDGAVWIHDWIKKAYPCARAILDFYHVTEHVSKVGKLLIRNPAEFHAWLERNKGWLLESELIKVLDSIRALPTMTSDEEAVKLAEIKYLERNKARMDYKQYRDLNLQIGSGAIESTHRTLVQQRMKKSGQRWSNEGAQNMLNLRVCSMSKRWNLVVNKASKAAA